MGLMQEIDRFGDTVGTSSTLNVSYEFLKNTSANCYELWSTISRSTAGTIGTSIFSRQ